NLLKLTRGVTDDDAVIAWVCGKINKDRRAYFFKRYYFLMIALRVIKELYKHVLDFFGKIIFKCFPCLPCRILVDFGFLPEHIKIKCIKSIHQSLLHKTQWLVEQLVKGFFLFFVLFQQFLYRFFFFHRQITLSK